MRIETPCGPLPALRNPLFRGGDPAHRDIRTAVAEDFHVYTGPTTCNLRRQRPLLSFTIFPPEDGAELRGSYQASATG